MLIVIPARYGSERFPGKPLIDICGKPMVIRVWERCREAGVDADQIIVATDDPQISNVCAEHGVRVEVVKEPCRTGGDRAAALLEEFPNEDFWCIVGADAPCLPRDTISTLVENSNNRIDVVIAASIFNSKEEYVSPNSHKLVGGSDHRVLYVSRACVPHGKPWWTAMKMLNAYVLSRETLEQFAAAPSPDVEQRERLELTRFLYRGTPVKYAFVDIEDGNGLEVDSPEDVPAVVQWWKDRLEK